MKKTLMSVLLIIMLVGGMFTLTACNNNNSSEQQAGQTNDAPKSGKNNKVYELIEKLEPTNTIEEANKIVGFDAKLTDEKYYIYEYDFGGDYKLILKYYSANGKTADIEMKYNRDDLRDEKVTLKNAPDLKKRLQNREKITYDQFKEAVGGVDGTLTGKTKYTKGYIWVTKDGGYISTTFNARDNTCSYFAYTN